MNPDDHKTAPRCPLHTAPMTFTGEEREGRHVFRCPVTMGRQRCSIEIERPIGFTPEPTTTSTDTEL